MYGVQELEIHVEDGPEEMERYVVDHGVRAFEIATFDYEDKIDELISLKERYGIYISAHAPHLYSNGVDLATSDESLRQYSIEEIKKAVLIAEQIGSETLVTHIGVYEDDRADGLERTIDSYNQIAAFASEHNVDVLVENLPYKMIDNNEQDTGRIYVGATIEELREIADRTGLGLTYDVGHLFVSCFSRGTDYYEEDARVWDELGDVVKHVHLYDTWLEDHDKHQPIGKADMDVERVVQTMRDAGYEGRVVLEIAGNMEERLDSYEKAAEYLEREE
ncbi:MAG: sugar phosphate isomerase/epimerase family protein [Candidatus Undinarchaeales archaeon]|jgi:sugar phosphate isomerase/epimerase|nr:sugar phosphate isomerase/epimerase family protein [Candidatus Undinarchaeales archaeon]MDP7493397.1 sugar phosphate isomerase/epimerase family protein [Candidatus Undinarchaeales archaeon]